MDYQYIYVKLAWQKGIKRYNPSILLAFRIARYFGMAIEDIFIYEEEDDDGR